MSKIPKKGGKSRAKYDATELAKEFAKLRDGYICQHCQDGKVISGSNAHGSHIVPVSRSARLSCNPRNIKCLCFHCHMNWWHKHPIEAAEWYVENYADNWEYLRDIQNNQKGSVPKSYYDDWIVVLKQLIKERKEVPSTLRIEQLPF